MKSVSNQHALLKQGEFMKNLISSKEYDFLRTNEHLKDRIIFLTFGGSHAYGTNVEGSDIDIRGCALNRKEDILGLSNFEQFVNTETDTTVYSFNKLISLLLSCNPNTIELLGCRPEHYFVMTKIGKEMIDNRKMFLSRRAINAFGGYATQQLRRLENALARDKLPQNRKEEHIRNSMNSSIDTFHDQFGNFDRGSIKLYTDVSNREGFEKELYADINLQKYPVRDFNSLLNCTSNVVGIYDKLNTRNKKKDDAHLNKHAQHLVRLYLMCFDILEKEEIITYRKKDRDFLLEIRNGKYQLADGTYKKEFFDLISECEKRLEYAKNNTSLPEKPNMKRVEEFVMEVNRKSIGS